MDAAGLIASGVEQGLTPELAARLKHIRAAEYVRLPAWPFMEIPKIRDLINSIARFKVSSRGMSSLELHNLIDSGFIAGIISISTDPWRFDDRQGIQIPEFAHDQAHSQVRGAAS
jgi:hypothetical protein